MAYLCKRRFANDARIQVHNTSSADFLRALLPGLSPDPVLFWLDAHFPGADYGLGSYAAEMALCIRLPLEDELHIIHELRPFCAARDVILIDDARIWLDMPFTSGPLPEALRPLCPAERNINFIADLFIPSHNIQIDTTHEGYIVIAPQLHRE